MPWNACFNEVYPLEAQSGENTSSLVHEYEACVSNNIRHTTMCPDVYNVMAKEEAKSTNMKQRGSSGTFILITFLYFYADIMVTSQRKNMVGCSYCIQECFFTWTPLKPLLNPDESSPRHKSGLWSIQNAYSCSNTSRFLRLWFDNILRNLPGGLAMFVCTKLKEPGPVFTKNLKAKSSF